ncbi:MAG: PhzF family phenazine biosynthesis protein [Acidobacteriota bacterium]
MKLPYYHVDAFTDRLFRGNPAGVILLSSGWLPEQVMQKIAYENNLSETAFIIEDGEDFGLRWFTPTIEVDLCGHATVAAAHVLFNEIGHKQDQIRFQTKSGIVSVERREKTLVLDFPSRPPVKCSCPLGPARILGKKPAEVRKSRDYLFVFNEEEDILNMTPDFVSMKNWECLGVIVTAPGKTADFVSRFFAPRAGVNEDPVTGSAHSTLIPYWAERLRKTSLKALQLSERGGELFCQEAGKRVKIGGRAITYLSGEIYLQI